MFFIIIEHQYFSTRSVSQKRLTMSTNYRDYVIIGVKPIMNYVVACMTLFNDTIPIVKIRARGRNISKAVDVVEMMRRIFLKDLLVNNVEIGTEQHKNLNGRETSVSTIEIAIRKP